MKKISLTIIIAAVALTVGAQAPSAKEITGGFNSPESIAAAGKYLYVSNMGSKNDPTAKDGDGYISRLSRKDGKVIDEKYITGLNSPKGIKIAGPYVFIADVDKVQAYNLKTKAKVWEGDLSSLGITYANDISVRGWGSIFVSSTDKNAIYKVFRKGPPKQVAIKGSIEGVNGLYHAAPYKLYVANYGRGDKPDGSFGLISLCSKKYKSYQTGGVYDGIQKVCGRIVVSDWVDRKSNGAKGTIWAYCVGKKQLKEVQTGKTLGGPSDIYADRCTKTLWIPCMLDNKLVGVPFKMITAKK